MDWIKAVWIACTVPTYWHPHRTGEGSVMRRRAGTAVEYREMTDDEAADDAAGWAIR